MDQRLQLRNKLHQALLKIIIVCIILCVRSPGKVVARAKKLIGLNVLPAKNYLM